MTSDYERRQAERAQKEQSQEAAERGKEIIIGETTGKITKNIDAGKELKIKIGDAETLQLKLSGTLVKGDSVKITIKADPELSEHKMAAFGRAKATYPDEASGKITGTIGKDSEIKIKIDNMDVEKFRSSAGLDKGDSIRLNIVKA